MVAFQQEFIPNLQVYYGLLLKSCLVYSEILLKLERSRNPPQNHPKSLEVRPKSLEIRPETYPKSTEIHPKIPKKAGHDGRDERHPRRHHLQQCRPHRVRMPGGNPGDSEMIWGSSLSGWW